MLDPADLADLISRDHALLLAEARGLAKGYAALADALRDGAAIPSHADAESLARSAARLAQVRERYDTYLWVSKQ